MAGMAGMALAQIATDPRAWQVLAAAAAVLAGLYAATWLVEMAAMRWGRQALAVLGSALDVACRRLGVDTLARRYPRVSRAITGRFDSREFTGLPLTVLSAAFLSVLMLLMEVVEEAFEADELVASDIHIDTLLTAVRMEELTNFFLWVTLLANWQIVLFLSLSATALLVIWSKSHLVAPLWVALAGSQLVTYAGKVVAGRPRPAGATYAEISYSFPSGHATVATAFYGFLIYLIWTAAPPRARTKASLAALGAVVAVLIGFSRLYLGVHYLSDVLAGYLVGALWLITGIAIAQWRERRGRDLDLVPRRYTRRATAAVVAASAAFFIYFGASRAPELTLAAGLDAPELIEGHPMAIFDVEGRPRLTSTIVGEPALPVNVMVLAAGDLALAEALRDASWQATPRTTWRSALRMIGAADVEEGETIAPGAVPFWSDRYVDFAFRKRAEQSGSVLAVRFWRTGFYTAEGLTVYVGLAGPRDPGPLPAGSRARPLDGAREALARDLAEAGRVAHHETRPLVPPSAGAGPTDGRIAIIVLSRGPAG